MRAGIECASSGRASENRGKWAAVCVFHLAGWAGKSYILNLHLEDLISVVKLAASSIEFSFYYEEEIESYNGIPCPTTWRLRSTQRCGSPFWSGARDSMPQRPHGLPILTGSDLWCVAKRFHAGSCASSMIRKPFTEVIIRPNPCRLSIRTIVSMSSPHANTGHQHWCITAIPRSNETA